MQFEILSKCTAINYKNNKIFIFPKEFPRTTMTCIQFQFYIAALLNKGKQEILIHD